MQQVVLSPQSHTYAHFGFTLLYFKICVFTFYAFNNKSHFSRRSKKFIKYIFRPAYIEVCTCVYMSRNLARSTDCTSYFEGLKSTKLCPIASVINQTCRCGYLADVRVVNAHALVCFCVLAVGIVERAIKCDTYC